MVDFNYSLHDSILKDVVKDIIRFHPLQIVQNIFLDKPLRFLHAYSKYISFTSFPIWCFLIVLFHFFMIEIEKFRNEIFQILKLLALIFIFSLIPGFLVYPATFVIADNVLILIMAILIVVFMYIIPKMRNIRSKLA